MTAFSQGEVILVAYPFEQRAGGRRRPALVVSSASYNQETGELVICQITSRVGAPPRPGDYHVQDWQQANLPRPAMVRARLTTLPASLVLRSLGMLSDADFRGAMAGLTDVLRPPEPPAPVVPSQDTPSPDNPPENA